MLEHSVNDYGALLRSTRNDDRPWAESTQRQLGGLHYGEDFPLRLGMAVWGLADTPVRRRLPLLAMGGMCHDAITSTTDSSSVLALAIGHAWGYEANDVLRESLTTFEVGPSPLDPAERKTADGRARALAAVACAFAKASQSGPAFSKEVAEAYGQVLMAYTDLLKARGVPAPVNDSGWLRDVLSRQMPAERQVAGYIASLLQCHRMPVMA